MKLLASHWFPFLLGIIILIVIINDLPRGKASLPARNDITAGEWTAPDITSLPDNEEAAMIRYGKELIVNTARYLGPKGSVAAITNGMNCGNCHIEAGARPYGNCFSAVASLYPMYRARSGRVESVEFRVNDCLQRSLNGNTIDSTSREMRAMVAYLLWVGKNVQKGVKPKGAGTADLPYLQRAADPLKGKTVYENNCRTCHGPNGEGVMNIDSTAFVYPPLWGSYSYNAGAGLYRLSRFAGYVKYNMPYGISTYSTPQLTDEEAWDVAAFVNSQPRPQKSFAGDWPKLSEKAIDHPFGPYTDNFTEAQHKYGPFEPIKKAKEEAMKSKK